MQQNIKYTGLATTPSDYDCPDGQLAVAMNTVNEEGGMKVLRQPTSQMILPAGCTIIRLHKTSAFTHYLVRHIYTRDDARHVRLLWFDSSVITDAQHLPVDWSGQQWDSDLPAEVTLIYDFGDTDTKEVNTVGNTIVILKNDGLLYFLWKNNKYNTLGSDLPQLDVSFGLQGESISSSEFLLSYSNGREGATGLRFDGSGDYFPYNTGDVKRMRGVDYYQGGHYYFTENPDVDNCVYGQIDSLVAQIHRNGKFVYPFMVRCAYRLYDETLTMHSSPVLMVADTVATPRVIVKSYTQGQYGNEDINCQLATIQYDLVLTLRNFERQLQNWADIISSVDIFVTTPFYTYSKEERISTWSNMESRAGICIAKVASPLYLRQSTDTILGGTTQVNLHQRDIHNDIRDCNIFRLLYSININDLQNDSNTIIIHPNFDLSTLSTREAMTDDTGSRDKLMPSTSFVYNSRLMLLNVQKEFNDPLRPSDYVCMQDSEYYPWYRFYVLLKKTNKEIVVKGETAVIGAEASHPFYPFLYVYYPDPDAYKIVVESNLGYCELPLVRHDFLNGAYFLWDGWEPNPTTVTTLPTVTTDNNEDSSNKIYISDVGNPFTFPTIKSIGCDSVMGVAAVTKPLSEGQFGQQSLYTFTKEGVWTLDVDAEGNILPAHPTTYDVCTNFDSITQIEQSVLFVTDRGIMLLQGSDTVCITDGILGDSPFDPATLPHLDEVANDINGYHVANSPMTHDFLAGCRMIYDYMHQHIIVFNPEMTSPDGRREYAKYPYAHVYSLKSKLWGMMQSNLASTVNSYPDALAITRDRQLVSFASSEEQSVKGLLVTRPFKLGAPDAYKTIHNIVQRGVFHKGNVKTLLYGSRDLYNWHLVGSSVDHWLRGLRGTPFKYFRIALLTDLTPGESVNAVTVDFEPKETNKMH